MVAVDVPGSHACLDLQGSRCIPGIGASQRSRFFNSNLMDGFSAVHPAVAIATCRWLAQLGVSVGGSSGATVAGALEMLRRWPTVTDVVCVCADGGANYQQTIYDDAWSKSAGYLDTLLTAMPAVVDVESELAHREAVSP